MVKEKLSYCILRLVFNKHVTGTETTMTDGFHFFQVAFVHF